MCQISAFWMLGWGSTAQGMSAEVQLCIWEVFLLVPQYWFRVKTELDLVEGFRKFGTWQQLKMCWQSHQRILGLSHKLCTTPPQFSGQKLRFSSFVHLPFPAFNLGAQCMFPALIVKIFQAKLHQGVLCPPLCRLWLLCRGTHLWWKLRV